MRTRRITYGTVAKIRGKGRMRRAVEINMATSTVYVDEEDTEDVTTLTASPSVENKSHPPWSYLVTMFGYLGMGENPKSYRIKCLLCLPMCHNIKTFKNSPSNPVA